jgi:chitodextrinase
LEVNGFCSEYTGVAQGAPEATNGISQFNGNTISNTINPSDDAWVISIAGSGSAGSFTHGQGQVEVLDFQDSSSTFAVAELRGASGETSLSSTYSGTVNRLCRVAASWTMAIEDNYKLDLEVQWTNATYDQPNEELAIYGGTMGAENIRVDVWTGSSWNNLLNDLSTGWNNISVTGYLTSPTFSIRFKGGTETGDSSQDTWEIDCTLLHTSGGSPPVANFSYTSESPYTGETITFNASTSFDSDGSIVNYNWDFGDQTNGTGLTTTHVYNDNGTYPVNLTVTDDQGLTDTVTKDVTVLNRVPVASFTESAYC